MMRPIFLLLGVLFFVLAIVGALLPMIPGLLFLVLSAACFARSSQLFHGWLMNSKWLGPMIRDWQHHRSVSRRSKLLAIVGTIVFGGCSIYFMIEPLWMQWVALFFMTTGIAIVASLKSRVPATA